MTQQQSDKDVANYEETLATALGFKMPISVDWTKNKGSLNGNWYNYASVLKKGFTQDGKGLVSWIQKGDNLKTFTDNVKNIVIYATTDKFNITVGNQYYELELHDGTLSVIVDYGRGGNLTDSFIEKFEHAIKPRIAKEVVVEKPIEKVIPKVIEKPIFVVPEKPVETVVQKPTVVEKVELIIKPTRSDPMEQKVEDSMKDIYEKWTTTFGVPISINWNRCKLKNLKSEWYNFERICAKGILGDKVGSLADYLKASQHGLSKFNQTVSEIQIVMTCDSIEIPTKQFGNEYYRVDLLDSVATITLREGYGSNLTDGFGFKFDRVLELLVYETIVQKDVNEKISNLQAELEGKTGIKAILEIDWSFLSANDFKVLDDRVGQMEMREKIIRGLPDFLSRGFFNGNSLVAWATNSKNAEKLKTQVNKITLKLKSVQELMAHFETNDISQKAKKHTERHFFGDFRMDWVADELMISIPITNPAFMISMGWYDKFEFVFEEKKDWKTEKEKLLQNTIDSFEKTLRTQWVTDKYVDISSQVNLGVSLEDFKKEAANCLKNQFPNYLEILEIKIIGKWKVESNVYDFWGNLVGPNAYNIECAVYAKFNCYQQYMQGVFQSTDIFGHTTKFDVTRKYGKDDCIALRTGIVGFRTVEAKLNRIARFYNIDDIGNSNWSAGYWHNEYFKWDLDNFQKVLKK
jgi:hypothetical protein